MKKVLLRSKGGTTRAVDGTNDPAPSLLKPDNDDFQTRGVILPPRTAISDDFAKMRALKNALLKKTPALRISARNPLPKPDLPKLPESIDIEADVPIFCWGVLAACPSPSCQRIHNAGELFKS